MIGICGGGIGGSAAAIALRQAGREVVVFEQASRKTVGDTSRGRSRAASPNCARCTETSTRGPALLDACDEVLKSALYVRDPLPVWSLGRATLLGDAAHPMMPFMAQGAGQAVEDAVVLARQLADSDDAVGALKAYEASRRERTARIQIASRDNTWLRDTDNADWVYGYDAWTVPLN